MSHILFICAILCATFFCVILAGVPLNNFYRFGKDDGDKETVGDGVPDRVDLEPSFRIFGKERDYVYVYRNGWIELAGGYIMPFRFEPENSQWSMGTTFYKQSNEEVDLDKAQREIGSAFPAFQHIDLKWVVIGTWRQIRNPNANPIQMKSNPNDLNTFQAILTTDGVRSFVIYNYNQTQRIEKETWSGFILTHAADVYSYTIKGSSTDDILTINQRSNVNIPGKWVFRIDLPKIYEPSSLCPQPQQPANGFCKTNEYVPGVLAQSISGSNMNFFERFVNFINEQIEYMRIKEQTLTLQQPICNKAFGTSFPSLREIVKNVSLLFVNSNEFLTYSRPISSKIIHIGGILQPTLTDTIKETKVKEILDNSKIGVILVSFGTSADASKMSMEMRKGFVEAFRHFPAYDFIWKYESSGHNKSDAKLLATAPNVHTVKWVEQRAILGTGFEFYNKTSLP